MAVDLLSELMRHHSAGKPAARSVSSDHSQRLHRDGGRNFGGRKNDDARQKRFEQAAQMESHGTVAEQDRRAERDAIADKLLQALEDVAERHNGRARRALPRGLRLELPLKFGFDAWIERRTLSFRSSLKSGWTRERPSAWRAASTKATWLLFTGAVSSSASRMVVRSRIETCSRKSC